MKLQFSAGGIVYKKTADQILILVAQHSMHHGWVFPKGLIGDHIADESKEETAIREVEEETGARAKIIKYLGPSVFEFEYNSEEIKKTVYCYLMEYIDGDITQHDYEMENVEWLPIEEVENRLTYPSDKNIWVKTKNLLKNTV